MFTRRYTIRGLLILATLTLFSCQKEGLVEYHGGDCISFQKHSSFLSFLGYTSEVVLKDTLAVDLAVAGDKADYDRYVSAIAIEDEAGTKDSDRKTTAKPDEYRILGGVVKAGEIYGKFEIEFLNSERLATEDLKLRIALQPSEDFELGLAENTEIDLTWTRKLLQPKTWTTMAKYFCSTYSTRVYQTIITVTGLDEIPDDMSREELRVWGRKFGDYVRKYEVDNGKPMLHDDGVGAGTIITPLL